MPHIGWRNATNGGTHDRYRQKQGCHPVTYCRMAAPRPRYRLSAHRLAFRTPARRAREVVPGRIVDTAAFAKGGRLIGRPLSFAAPGHYPSEKNAGEQRARRCAVAAIAVCSNPALSHSPGRPEPQHFVAEIRVRRVPVMSFDIHEAGLRARLQFRALTRHKI